MSKILVIGPTGNIGSKIIKDLLPKKIPLVALARSTEKLKSEIAGGLEVISGDLSSSEDITRALNGVSTAFFMVPPNYGAPDSAAYQDSVIANLFAAAEKSQLKHIVLLSSVGAQHEQGTGLIAGLHRLEKKFSTLKMIHTISLRAGYFMENLFLQAQTVKTQNITGSPIKADAKISMVATQDIAQLAADLLQNATFTGHTVRYVLGAADVSYADVTAELSRLTGKTLNYVQFPYDAATQAMVGMGLSQSTAEGLVGIAKGVNEGLVVATQPRTAANTTPTKLSDFLPAVAAAAQG